MGVHYFSSQAPTWSTPTEPDLLGRIAALRQDMRSAGLAANELKPILVEESSYTGSVGQSTANPNDPFNQGQRDYATKALSRAAAADVLGLFWFWLRDTPAGLGADNAYGLLTATGDQKPSYRSLRYFTSLIGRTSQFVRRVSGASPKLEGYEFVALDGRRVQVIWNEADAELLPYAPPGVLTSVIDPTGSPLASGGASVQVGSEPRYLFYVPACTPRPRVSLYTVHAGPGVLQTTIAAGTSAGTLTNSLLSVQVDASPNVTVDLGGRVGAQGPFGVSLPAQTQWTTLVVHRVGPGAAMVRLAVTDECGVWRTFVGGGANAF